MKGTLATLFWITAAALLGNVNSQTISTVDTELSQIHSVLMSKENIIKTAIKVLQGNIAVAIDATSATQAFTLKESLQKLQDLLGSLVTVATYGPYTSASTCNDVTSKCNEVLFQIKWGCQINFDVVKNNTQLLIHWNNLNVAYLSNFHTLTNDQREKIQIVLTATNILYNHYNQYSIAIVGAIVKYGILYVHLLFFKNNLCVASCPTALSAGSQTELSKIDASVKQIQTTLNLLETAVRDAAVKALTDVDKASPDIRLNPVFISITTTFNSVSTLLKEIQTLTTSDSVNVTMNCDGAALQIAFIKFKLLQYIQANTQIGSNSTILFSQYGNLQTQCALNYLTLSATQKQNLEAAMGSLLNLAEAFRQYLLALATSSVKLVVLLFESQNARGMSCNCTGNPADGE